MSADGETKPRSVVVCGGGVIGACTAYYLARECGAKITLVEKSSVACGASGKAAGFLTSRLLKHSRLSQLASVGFDLHQELYTTLRQLIPYSYERITALDLCLYHLSNDERPSFTTTSSFETPPWVDSPAVSSPRRIGDEIDTALVHPRLFTQAIVEAAVNYHDLEVVYGKVERVEVKGGRAIGVLVSNKQSGPESCNIPAEAVVLALGAWSMSFEQISSLFNFCPSLAPSIVLQLKNSWGIPPCALQVSFSPSKMEDIPESDARLMMTFPKLYASSTGEVNICGVPSSAKILHDPEEDITDSESLQMLDMAAETLSSQLRTEEAKLVARQVCVLQSTTDMLPVIGEVPGIKGCYVGTGHHTWGILTGPATGVSLADLILKGKSTRVDLSPFSPTRPMMRMKWTCREQ